MKLLAFAAVGLGASILPWRILGLNSYLGMMALIGVLEQSYFFLKLAQCLGGDVIDASIAHTKADVALAGADIDIVGIALLLFIWVASRPRTQRVSPKWNIQRVEFVWNVIFVVLICCDSLNVAAILMFARMYDPTTNSISFPRSRAMSFVGFLVLAVVVPVWFKLTLVTPSIGSIETLYQAFQVDPIHTHHFYIIFLGSWFVVPVIWSLPTSAVLPTSMCAPFRPWVRIVSVFFVKTVLTVIFMANITLCYYLLWLLSAPQPTEPAPLTPPQPTEPAPSEDTVSSLSRAPTELTEETLARRAGGLGPETLTGIIRTAAVPDLTDGTLSQWAAVVTTNPSSQVGVPQLVARYVLPGQGNGKRKRGRKVE